MKTIDVLMAMWCAFTFIMFALSHVVWHNAQDTVYWGVLTIFNYITLTTRR